MKHTLTPFFKPYDAPKGKRVYVSGPMTGIGDNNGPAFDGAAATLRAMGYAVCNPNETDQILGPLSFEQYMRFDYQRVLEADFLIALPQWERSRGALAEILCAIRIGTPVWGWEDWDDYDRIREARVNRAIADLYSGKTVTVAHEAKQKALATGEPTLAESATWPLGAGVEIRAGSPAASNDGRGNSVVRTYVKSMGLLPERGFILLDEDKPEREMC